MNIHPLIIHFPIALLTIYTFLECIRLRKLVELKEWFYIKATFVILGELGALAAIETGDFGKSLYPAARAIINMHENFADATAIVFGLIAMVYLIFFIDKIWGEQIQSTKFSNTWNTFTTWMRKLFNAPVQVIFAITGFILLSITGGLGGSIVYGVNSDPFTQFVNALFVK